MTIFVGVAILEHQARLARDLHLGGVVMLEAFFFAKNLDIGINGRLVGLRRPLLGGEILDAQVGLAGIGRVVEVDLTLAGVQRLPGGRVFQRELALGVAVGQRAGLRAGAGGGLLLA